MAQPLLLDEPFLDDVLGFLESSGLLASTPRQKAMPIEPTIAHDSDSQASVSGGESKLNCSQEEKREIERHRQRRYRKKIKETRQSLVKQVDELSTEVARLSEQVAKNSSDPSSSSWVTVLSRQREKRKRAEEERERLVAAVNSQAEYIKRLSASCYLLSDDNLTNSRLVCSIKVPRLHPMQSATYTTYLPKLESCYARVDSVLEASGLQFLPQTIPFLTERHMKKDGEVAYVQILNKTLFPSSYKATCDAMWRTLNMYQGGEFTASVPDNEFIDWIRLLTPLPKAEICQRYVTRRYVEPNRVVIVWANSYEGDGIFKGLYSDELGWLCIRPCGSGTQVELTAQQIPMRCGLPGDEEPALDKFYKALESSLSKDKDMIHAGVDDLLCKVTVSN